MERRIHYNSIKLQIKLNERLDFVCNYTTHLFAKFLDDGMTPAKASGVQVEGDNKWLTIIQNASLNT